ncbi:MAG: SDR family oxidoreductase [Planctomycetota bacterium]
MDLDLTGKHALVCGASSGIGRAAAVALAEQGAAVTALARSGDALEALVGELTGRGLTARALVADLEDLPGLGQVIAGLLDAHGPVHVLLNNTGGPPGGPLLEAEPEAFERAFRRHVLAAHTLVRGLLPGMRAAGYGRILNVISTSVREPIPNLGVSNTIRGAMASWAKTLSKELPPGVTINSILPGYVDTGRLTSLAEGIAGRTGSSVDAVRERWLSTVPEGRLGRPEELAGVLAFLASPAGAFVRGVCLPVDGGRLNSI